MATTYRISITKTSRARTRNGVRPEPVELTIFTQEIAPAQISKIVAMVFGPEGEATAQSLRPVFEEDEKP